MNEGPEIVVKHGKLEDFPLPETVYKYRDWSDDYHKRFITHLEVFMSSPRSFEDELDCHNPTRFDLLTKKQIYEYFEWYSKRHNKGFSRQQHREFARQWSKQSRVNNKEFVKQYMADSVEEYYDHVGILSLTENWNNDAMWIKYANEEKGFCIGYNTIKMFSYLGGGGKVDYVDEIPIVMPEPFMQTERAMRNRDYYKLNKWRFEDEYRTVKFWPHKASIEDRQINLPKEAFKHILLGDNISNEHKNEIVEITRKYIGDIDIINRKDFE